MNPNKVEHGPSNQQLMSTQNNPPTIVNVTIEGNLIGQNSLSEFLRDMERQGYFIPGTGTT